MSELGDENRAVIEAIVNLGRAFGQQTIAEGCAPQREPEEARGAPRPHSTTRAAGRRRGRPEEGDYPPERRVT